MRLLTRAGGGTDWYVDAEDAGLIHVAALLDPQLDRLRIQAWGSCFSWIPVAILLRRFHGVSVHSIPPKETRSRITTDTLAGDILERWKNRGAPRYGGLWKNVFQIVDETVRVVRQRLHV